jgi:uncharacterized protein YacL
MFKQLKERQCRYFLKNKRVKNNYILRFERANFSLKTDVSRTIHFHTTWDFPIAPCTDLLKISITLVISYVLSVFHSRYELQEQRQSILFTIISLMLRTCLVHYYKSLNFFKRNIFVQPYFNSSYICLLDKLS